MCDYVVPINPKEVFDEFHTCDRCGKRSKYMFQRLDKDWESGKYELVDEYCFRCIGLITWKA